VPGYKSPVCPCGHARETAAHVVVHCPRFTEAREYLTNMQSGRLDLRSLVGTEARTQRFARWFMQLNILPQFKLAKELLYGEQGSASAL
jgi:hypothetical protein